MQLPIALAFQEKKVKLSDFTVSKIHNHEITDLMQKINVTPYKDLQQTDTFRRSQIVEIKFNDGIQIRESCDYFPGTPYIPILNKECFAKYKDCASLAMQQNEIEESINLNEF